MKRTFQSLLVASAAAVAAASSLGAVGIHARQQGGQAQPSRSSQSSPSPQPPSQDQAAQPGKQDRDDTAARQELMQAKQALLEITKMPEASQLQGDARNNVIQIINSFNSLVTAQNDWYDRYKDVAQQVIRALGEDMSAGTGSAGAESGSVGTSGTSSANLPAPIRARLVEFRDHLTAFAKAAGAPDNGAVGGMGSTAAEATGGSSSAGQSQAGAMGGGSSSTQGATGTAAQGAANGSMTSASGETLQQHLDAIADLVQQALGSGPASSGGGAGTAGTSGSSTETTTTTGQAGTSSATSSAGTVTIDRATLEQIQAHVQRLRELARQRGIQ